MPADKQLLALLTLVTLSSITLAQNQPIPPRPADPRGAAPAPERRADVMGRITAVSPDGRTLTLTAPPPRSADGQPPARPEPTTVTLTDRTQLLFFGVSEGEAKPAPGLMAMVWLDEGSKDQAARVRFMKREGEERPDIQGRVLSVSPDARTLTIETRDADKPTGKIDLHLAPYTQSLYYGIERDGARPTVDYQVVAWLEKGSRDVPLKIRFMKNDGRDSPPGAAPLPPQPR
jgi:hypothetical protein